MFRRVIPSVLFCVFCTAGGHSQSSNPTVEPIAGTLKPMVPINEHLADLIDVAAPGGPRVGLVSGSLDRQVNLSSLSVRVPASELAGLCIGISSRDGRYAARAQYDISSATPGVYRLNFPTSHASVLTRYLASELAVLAELADDCDTPDESTVFAVASWDPQVPQAPIHVLLNVRDADARIYIPAEEGDGEFIDCVRFDDVNTAFDTRCEIVALQDADLESAVILRQTYERHHPRLPMPIRLK